MSENWVGAQLATTVSEMRQRIALLEAENRSLKWREITENDLPKVGDEVGGVSDSESYPWMCRAVSAGMARERNASPLDRDWERLGYTHFRPINPPLPEPPK